MGNSKGIVKRIIIDTIDAAKTDSKELMSISLETLIIETSIDFSDEKFIR